MWEGQALPHDTKFGNSRCEIVGRRVIFIWSLIHGLRWSGLIKAEPGLILICPLQHQPYLMRKENSDEYEGFIKDILDEISAMIGIQFR